MLFRWWGANFTSSADAEGTLPGRAPKRCSKKLPKEVYGETRPALGELWQSLWELWESSGRLYI